MIDPTTPEAAERARFEAWAKSQHYNLGRDKYGGYASIASHAAWAAWQAALAAQEGGSGERYEVVSKRTGAVWLTTSDPHYLDDWAMRDAFIMRPCAAQEGTGNG